MMPCPQGTPGRVADGADAKRTQQSCPRQRQVKLLAALATLLVLNAPALARPRGPALVALAPAEDARKAIALGPAGEVYAPDGKGEWIRNQAISTADPLAVAGRAGPAVVALGDGVVYRLADNGWSAIRLVQKGKAVMSGGGRAVAAVGRQLFALDRTAGGEPAKLALAPDPVLAIGSGAKGVVVITARGLLRLDGAAFKRIDRPRRVERLISDRWALADRGAIDLRGGAITAWPAGLSVEVAAPAPDDGLVAVGVTRAGLELVTIAKAKVVRDPIAGTAGAKPAGVVLDKSGRATVALSDGRMLHRERGSWSTTTIRDSLPADRPGAAPATSP